MPLAVTLSSLLRNLKSPLPVRIFILSTSLSAEAKRRLTRAIMLEAPECRSDLHTASIADLLSCLFVELDI